MTFTNKQKRVVRFLESVKHVNVEKMLKEYGLYSVRKTYHFGGGLLNPHNEYVKMEQLQKLCDILLGSHRVDVYKF